MNDFARLEAAQTHQRLREELASLFAGPLSRPWSSRAVDGHVPVASLRRAVEQFPEVFKVRGLYIWGAGDGDSARICYVGKTIKSLAQRMNNRYLQVKEKTAAAANELEFAVAERYSEKLRALPGTFSPLEPPDATRYADIGIPAMRNAAMNRRLVRAEYYVKRGLERVWYYPLPAAEASKERIGGLEKSLIFAASAQQFAYFRAGDRGSLPMLNGTHVGGRLGENPFVERSLQQDYATWLGGQSAD